MIELWTKIRTSSIFKNFPEKDDRFSLQVCMRTLSSKILLPTGSDAVQIDVDHLGKINITINLEVIASRRLAVRRYDQQWDAGGRNAHGVVQPQAPVVRVGPGDGHTSVRVVWLGRSSGQQPADDETDHVQVRQRRPQSRRHFHASVSVEGHATLHWNSQLKNTVW